MKKIFRTFAAFAIVSFAGCTSELNNEVITSSDGLYISLENCDVKTYIGELNNGFRKVFWSEGDQIAVNGAKSREANINNENAGVAYFEFGSVLNYPYSILYPAEMYKNETTITLPSVQTAADNSFGVDASAMAGYCEVAGERPTLSHLTAAIRLQLKGVEEGDAHRITKVVFTSTKQVSGDFTIDYQNATIAPAAADVAGNKSVRVNVDKELSTEAATDVFVVVPAQEYTDGFTIRIMDSAGHFMEKSSGKISLQAGEILPMPVLEFVPTGTDLTVEIASAEQLVQFANDYNAGYYSDAGENLEVSLTQDVDFENVSWVSIGTNDLPFNGVFDGKKKSIKNWHSNYPLFYKTTSTSTIQNLTVDNTCSYTAGDELISQTAGNYLSVFVRYHDGKLFNCINHAEVTITGADWGSISCIFGAFAGRLAGGTVDHCENYGAISFSSQFSSTNVVSEIGGIVGYCSASSKILNCTNEGIITIRGSFQELNCAGVVGKPYGNIVYCNNIANILTDGASASTGITIGGIGGTDQNTTTYTSCRNTGNLTCGEITGNTKIGGIVGASKQASTEICQCINKGDIIATTNNTNKKVLWLGGVGAQLAKAGLTVSKCKSYCQITINGELGDAQGKVYGLLVAVGPCNVNDSSAGGNVLGTTVDSDNFNSYLLGTTTTFTTETDSANSYWDGIETDENI